MQLAKSNNRLSLSFLAYPMALMLTACLSTRPARPARQRVPFRAPVYLASSQDQALVSSSGELIRALDVRFDGFSCMTLADHERLLRELLACTRELDAWEGH